MRHVIGIDLGQASESTGIVVGQIDLLPVGEWETIHGIYSHTFRPLYRLPDGGLTPKHPLRTIDIRHIERRPAGGSFHSIVERVKEITRGLSKPTVALDATGVGEKAVDLFRRAGLRPEVVTITSGDKAVSDRQNHRVPKLDLISTSQVMLQNGTVRIARSLPLAEALVRELAGFRMKITVRTGVDAPAWREGAQDDLVLALATALWVADKKIKLPRTLCFGG